MRNRCAPLIVDVAAIDESLLMLQDHDTRASGRS
jgi:hypothetical protein